MQLDGLKLHQLYAVRRQWVRLDDVAKVTEIEAAIEARIKGMGLPVAAAVLLVDADIGGAE